VRDPNYWARDLNVRRGTNNFERITVKIYKDNTARLEALKAGEFDLMRFFSAGDWARRVTGKRFDTGELVKASSSTGCPRASRAMCSTPARTSSRTRAGARGAGPGVDYEWMNRQMFYNAYQRVNGPVWQHRLPATGEPGPEELALLEPWRGKVPDRGVRPDVRAAAHRWRLVAARQPAPAQGLLKPGRLGSARRQAAQRKGEAFVLEYLDSNEAGARVVTPWAQPGEDRHQLNVSGRWTLRCTSSGCRSSTSTSPRWPTRAPTTRARSMPTSSAARPPTPRIPATCRVSRARPSMRHDPAHDRRRSKAELLPACRALDRVISHSHLT
jgi:microcin C transport system substrate-binding protein